MVIACKLNATSTKQLNVTYCVQLKKIILWKRILKCYERFEFRESMNYYELIYYYMNYS